MFKPFRLLRAVEAATPGNHDAVLEQTAKTVAYFVSTLFLASGLVQVRLFVRSFVRCRYFRYVALTAPSQSFVLQAVAPQIRSFLGRTHMSCVCVSMHQHHAQIDPKHAGNT